MHTDEYIDTPRLRIRMVTETDWQSARQIWIDESRSPYAKYDIPSDTNEQAVRKRIARWVVLNRGIDHRFFAVLLGARMIGYVAFNRRDESKFELGYCFHSDFHGMGYAKESIAALIEYMRSEGATVFSAGAALSNTPSVRLLRSLGFQCIGTERVSFFKYDNGQEIVFDGGVFELIP